MLCLAENLQQYASYLDSRRKATKRIQSRMDVRDDTNEITIVAATNVHPDLAAQYILHQNIEKSKHFEAVFVNDHALCLMPTNSTQSAISVLLQRSPSYLGGGKEHHSLSLLVSRSRKLPE